MSEKQTFKNLGKFVSYEEKNNKGLDLVVVSYTQPRYQDPTKVWTLNIPTKDISDKLLETIGNASSGEEYCFHTSKNDKGFSQLDDITDAKDAQQAKKPWAGGAASKNPWQPKDDTGIAIGAAWTNALEWLKLQNGVPNVSMDTVESIAWDIVKRKQAQEAKLRASKPREESKHLDEVTTKPTVKKLSKLEEMKAKKATVSKVPELIDEDEPNFDDLDEDINQ